MMDWKQLFANSSNNSLEFFPPQIIDGIPKVVPPNEVFDDGVKEWQYSVVAQFLGKPPNFSLLHSILSKLWEKKGFVCVRLLRSPLYVIQFENAAARDWILKNGPWHVKHNTMILRKWEPNLGRLNFDLESLPVWIHMHHVPLELFNKTGLGYLASAVGVPFYMDGVTATRKRLAFAKVCVEVKASTVIPDQIPLKLGDGSSTSVAVSVPWKPPSCSSCNKFGHVDEACPMKMGKLVWQPKEVTAASKDSQGASTSAGTAFDRIYALSSEVASTTKLPLGFAPSQANPNSSELGNLSDKSVSDFINKHSTSVEEGFTLVTRKNTSQGMNARPSLLRKKNTGSDGQSKKLTQITGSSNIFLALCAESTGSESANKSVEPDTSKENFSVVSLQEHWDQLIDNAVSRKPRAAANGVKLVLQELKSRKVRI